MTRLRALTAVGVMLVVVLASLNAWLYASGYRAKPPSPEPPADPAYALELVDAVNAYYEKEGEYPPYLLGGLAEDSQLPDPLIESGILKSYPEVEKHRPGGRLIEPIQNIVSSPNDPYVVYLRDKYKDKALAVARRLKARGERDNWSDSPQGPDLVSKVQRAFSYERFLCGGGIHLSRLREGREKLVIPETLQFVDGVYRAIQLAEENPDPVFLMIVYSTVGSEFGYQRGEYVVGDKRACWLWFYADKPVLTGYLDELSKPEQRVVGLDLVDADDGLIQPDGIPDGIVLLYKLKEGKVVEVVKDYD